MTRATEAGSICLMTNQGHNALRIVFDNDILVPIEYSELFGMYALSKRKVGQTLIIEGQSVDLDFEDMMTFLYNIEEATDMIVHLRKYSFDRFKLILDDSNP